MVYMNAVDFKKYNPAIIRDYLPKGEYEINLPETIVDILEASESNYVEQEIVPHHQDYFSYKGY